MNNQVVLIVLDGWGYRLDKEHNAVAAAHTPTFDHLWKKNPNALLRADGLAVGLPSGQVGNSEIGHMTIGAGKVLDTDLVRIGKAAHDDKFADRTAFISLLQHVKKNDGVIHVIGLLGTGGVHSHQEHLHSFLKICADANNYKVAIHLLTDGRDSAPDSSLKYLNELQKEINKIGIGQISSIAGRYWGMDRDNNWNRLEKYENIIFDSSIETDLSIEDYVINQHKKGIFDEHLEPVSFKNVSKDLKNIKNGDGVFMFNFRSDRMRMLTERLIQKREEKNLFIVSMTEYSKEFDIAVAFPPEPIETTLGKEISKAGLTQARIAETEKFPHATYFLNGGVEGEGEGEEHTLIPSRKDVATHDLAPEMKAVEIADSAIEKIKEGKNFVFINFANPDMVGHTANVPAIITAIETTDRELGRVVNVATQMGAKVIVTADHGNAEINVDIDGKPHTSHTLSPVPLIVVGTNSEIKKSGSLIDIAPTILSLLNINKPQSMTGDSLII